MAQRKHQYRTLQEICLLHDNAWLTPQEAALYLNSTRGALAIRRTNGSGPEFGQHGAFIRYQKQALDAWLNPRLAAREQFKKELLDSHAEQAAQAAANG